MRVYNNLLCYFLYKNCIFNNYKVVEVKVIERWFGYILDKQTLLSPVVLCGPQDMAFNKSLIISFDHCASLKLGQWKLSIYSSNSSYNEPAQWEVSSLDTLPTLV